MTGAIEPEAGPKWGARAALDPLQAVLDPEDVAGRKNRLIDLCHRAAVTSAVSGATSALDFGCGVGRSTRWIVDLGVATVGIDPEIQMLRAAGRPPKAAFLQASGGALPFADASFDLVVSVGVLQYFASANDMLGVALSEIYRVLSTEGRLVAMEHVSDADLGRGSSRTGYSVAIRESGLHLRSSRALRASHSRLAKMTLRHWRVAAHLPLAFVLGAEAKWLARRPLTGGRYVETLFVASKASA